MLVLRAQEQPRRQNRAKLQGIQIAVWSGARTNDGIPGAEFLTKIALGDWSTFRSIWGLSGSVSSQDHQNRNPQSSADFPTNSWRLGLVFWLTSERMVPRRGTSPVLLYVSLCPAACPKHMGFRVSLSFLVLKYPMLSSSLRWIFRGIGFEGPQSTFRRESESCAAG